MARAPRIFLVATEPSGDLLGASLAKAIRARAPDAKFAGVGGEAMAGEAIASVFDIADLSVLGLFEGFKIWALVNQRAQETAEAVRDFDADAVVLIDSWGFSIRAAKRIRLEAPRTKIIKYVGPQVFATRPGRAKVLAHAVDRLLAIHPFDAPYYEPHGLPVSFVGNPALERRVSGDGAAFRTRHRIGPDEPLLLVLFGSRTAEVNRLAPRFSAALSRLRVVYPELRFATVVSSTVAHAVREAIDAHPPLQGMTVVEGGERRDAFSAADMALACSGTVTLELARAGVPTIAAYRLGWASWAVARAVLMRAKYISLVNLAADEALIPEFVQTGCTGDRLADAVAAFMEDPKGRAALSERLIEVTAQMKGPGKPPSEAAAEAVLHTLGAARLAAPRP